MNRTIFSFAVSSAIFVLFFSGIIRHDVDESAYIKLAAEKQFDVIGQVFIDTVFSGSAVLINEKYILSAAHVFIESDYRVDTILYNGQTVVTNQPYNDHLVDFKKVSILIKGEKHLIKKIHLNPNYLDSISMGTCDLAILELAKPIKKVKAANLNFIPDEMGANVVGVGYGVSGIADKPGTVAPLGKKIAGQNVIDSIGGFEYLGKSTLLFSDFDHPVRTDCNKMGSAVPRPLEYICGGGDSGGGLFRLNGNRWELVGICSGSSTDIGQLLETGYYGQVMRWTRVAVFEKWIRGIIING